MPKIKRVRQLVDEIRNGDASLEELINYYSYISKKYCCKYEGEVKKQAEKIANEMLRKAIKDCIERDEKYNISHFIHSRFQRFDKKMSGYDDGVEIKTLSELEELAYEGAIDARVEIFNRNNNLIKKVANSIFQDYLNKLKEKMNKKDDYSYLDKDYSYLNENLIYPNNIIEYNDIIQLCYAYSWDVLNNYYNKKENKEKKIFFSSHLGTKLEWYKGTFFKNNLCFENDCIFYDSEIDYVLVDKIEKMELEEMKASIRDNLNPKFKIVFDFVFSGCSYTDAAKYLGVTRKDTQRLKNKVLKIVRKNNINDYNC